MGRILIRTLKLNSWIRIRPKEIIPDPQQLKYEKDEFFKMSLTDLSLAILEKGLEGGHQVCLGDLLAHSRLQKITISKRGRRVVKNLKNSSFKCFSLGKLKYKICGSLLLTHYFKCSSNVQGFFMTAYLEFNVTRLSLIETLYIVTKVQKQMLILIKYRS